MPTSKGLGWPLMDLYSRTGGGSTRPCTCSSRSACRRYTATGTKRSGQQAYDLTKHDQAGGRAGTAPSAVARIFQALDLGRYIGSYSALGARPRGSTQKPERRPHPCSAA